MRLLHLSSVGTLLGDAELCSQGTLLAQLSIAVDPGLMMDCVQSLDVFCSLFEVDVVLVDWFELNLAVVWEVYMQMKLLQVWLRVDELLFVTLFLWLHTLQRILKGLREDLLLVKVCSDRCQTDT